MPKLYEVHASLEELLRWGELEQAFQLTAETMDQFDDGFLRFQYLCLAVRLGRISLALDWLENSLNSDDWFSTWFLRRMPYLQPLFDLPRFQACLQVLDQKEAEYWRAEPMKPITLVPPSAVPPYPLVVGLHGNGFNTLDAAEQWACAPRQGWLATLPLARHLVYPGKHWWDAHEENVPPVLSHVGSILSQFPVHPDRILWSGFSKGGEVAMLMALQGALNSNVFLTVGAGGYLHGEPERWRPIIEAASPDTRGLMMYNSYDLERSNHAGQIILSMLAERGIACQLIEYEADGHVFPSDFERRFQEAVTFLFDEK